MIDPTVAGLAAGFYVNSLQGSNNKELIFQKPIITISIDDKYEDLALIDLAVSNQNFVGSKGYLGLRCLISFILLNQILFLLDCLL